MLTRRERRRCHWPFVFVASIAIVSVGERPTATPRPPAPGANVREELELLQGARVLFAHQSVGWNLVGGLERLGAEAGAPLHIVELTPDSQLRPGTFAHLTIGQNGAPDSKLSMFSWVLRGYSTEPFDIALLKFCYVDINAGTDTSRLLATYQSFVSTLQARHPHTTFIHVTVPLRTSGGWKDSVNAWLGRWDARGDNIARNDYNRRLRSAYARDLIFDLAAVESTYDDGRRSTFDCSGQMCEQLAPEYSNDGGHLTEAASRKAASEVLRVLGAARRRQLAATRPLVESARSERTPRAVR